MLVGVLNAEVILKIIGSNSGWFGVIVAAFVSKDEIKKNYKNAERL